MVEVHKVSGAAFDGNVYLVLDEKPILVDAGMMAGPTLKNIKKFIDPAKIELIVLTHCHHDHSGAAPALKEATGARLMLSEKEVGCIGDELASVAYLFGQQAPEYKVDETLKEGLVWILGNGSWRSWRPQGTPPEACVFMSERKRCSSPGIQYSLTGTSAGRICSAEAPTNWSAPSRG